MTIKELVQMLRKFDSDAPVYFSSGTPGENDCDLDLKGVYEKYDYDDDNVPSTGYIEISLKEQGL